MKKKIHPKSYKIVAHCSCGNKISFYSIIDSDIYLDVCNKCHSFYTGKQRTLISGSRSERFKNKFDVSENVLL
ncbi:50S ribosomal protein L31 [Candidatus Riesia pediculicola]|uniref:50S ribosomal protein L31 n=1 Tax=Riesia pediculicola (strain USDA) TaxID=515618 RepID=D4G8H8_RIEPU|nr:50S ribosomal protein L31 [Candidatus Riesia pediculicola]ADD79841.1 ribosomal protein L31 [Candidatus Riesia pediculicola USDA]ARC53858.1 50S ribosomal protein L31 [Candidatus Riesia pediculicola]ARC54302.1 50S ribosomal protein L31 [Candidatus Riesia pediculicola]QOJ86488.1 50S ribosomal protein L31 [Candidatus Riesia pediculicola]